MLGEWLRRTVVLVDGFNLYHGPRASSGRRYLWLDLQQLSEALLKPDQVLVAVHYFTVMVRNDPDGHKRQDVYLQALDRHSDRLTIHLGRFQQRRARCPECRANHLTHEEKESDVALAAQLLEIAAARTAYVAILISGDSDFVPAVASARRVNPDLRIVAVFPPQRVSDALRAVSNASFRLGESRIRNSMLPPCVSGETGLLIRPDHWY